MLSYTYTATGVKLSQALQTGKGGTSTRRGYAGAFVFVNNAPGWVSTAHGRFVLLNGSWQNEFHLRDHLGNTRVVLMEEDTGTLATLQQNHYYPFGMLNPSLSTSNTIGALKDNRYLYNGKEFNDDFDLDWYDYGARFYDAQIGRWNSVDPLAEKKPWLSPYHFCSNNPLNRLDPDGRDDFELNSKGQIVNRIENKKADNIYILNNDGKRIDGQTINFEYGTITAVRNPTVKVKGKDGNVSDKTLTLFEVKGNDNATKMFEFLANPSSTGVEWTHAKIGAEKSEQNVIGSSHDKSSTPVGHYLRATKYTLKEVTHNHPSGNYLPSDGDKSGAKLYKQQNSNTLLNIYTYPNRYSGYDEKGTLDFSDFENMPTIEVIGTKKN